MAQTQTGVGTKTTSAPNNFIDASEFNSVNNTVNGNAVDAESRLAAIEGTSASIQSYTLGTLPVAGIADGTLAVLSDDNIVVYSKSDFWFRLSNNTLVITEDAFTITIDTNLTGVSNSDQFSLLEPMIQAGFTPITVNWGDLSSDVINTYNDPALLHTYASAGVYTVSVNSGTFDIDWEEPGGTKDGTKVTDISDFDAIVQTGTADFAWAGMTNMNISASNGPHTAACVSLFGFFFGDTVLTKIPVLELDNCVNIASLCQNCSNLTTVPLMDTSVVQNWSNAFRDCFSLVSVPNFDYSSASDLGSLYRGCALDTTSIDTIMAGFVASGLSGLSTSVAEGTSLAEASWSAQAQTDVATLRGNGWTVATN